jgi:hypothetical protein
VDPLRRIPAVRFFNACRFNRQKKKKKKTEKDPVEKVESRSQVDDLPARDK